ncbi:MAG TPA: serine hydrolase domain-containing protein [Pyrinomonadaceae bacterium]|nr:serine hydrolase domain-containing protein [Pyrinomonadaceae bacterium]
MSLRSAAARLSLFSLLLIVPLTISAQQPVGGGAPPSKPDEHLRVLKVHLAAFNAGDAAALKKFAAEHLSEGERRGQPPERVVEFELGFRRMIGGGFELYEVEKNTDAELIATLRVAGDFPLYARMVWAFDPNNPAMITSRRVMPTATPKSALPAKMTAQRLAEDVDARLTKMAAADKFSGVVLIAKDGKPVFQKAYGYADRETKTSNNLDTRFRLGSMNKMFTSVAIAQLVEAGKLKYTDKLAQVLPDYPNKEVAQKITVHHLLTHTSGLGDIFGPEFDKRKDELREIKDYVSLFANQPLRFEPGAGWSYSNGGFIVLGLIIEKLSGQSYYDYVQKYIYDAAGMKLSGSVPKTEKVTNLAVGYMKRPPAGQLAPNWETLPWRGMSAGGGDSTAGDLLRFAEALRNHKLLGAQLTETIVTGKTQPGSGADSKYAYGFEDDLVAGHRVVGHGGGAPGMNGQLDIYLDNGYTVVVLANLDPPVAQNVTGYIRERLQ